MNVFSQRVKIIFRSAHQSVMRAPSMTFAIIIVSLISSFLFSASLTLSEQLNGMKGFWYGKVEVSIFLSEGVLESDKNILQSALTADPLVKEVYYESKREAFERFSEQFKNSPAVTDNVTISQLPESFRVKLHDPETFNSIRDTYQYSQGVDVIQDQREVLKTMFSIVNMLQTATLTGAFALLVISTILISNTVRMAAVARRKEIKVMRLIGAPRLNIILPFILEGLGATLLGWILSVGVLKYLSFQYIEPYTVDNLAFPVVGWPDMVNSSLVTLGMVAIIASVSSWLTISKYVKH